MILFLIHSLRWPDAQNPRDRALRNLVAFFWVLDAFLWTRQGWPESAAVAAGAIFTLSIWAFHFWRTKHRGPLILPIASVATVLTGPGNWFIENSSPGLIALAASLLLFVLGVALALTRHKWDPPGARLSQPQQ